MDVYLSSLRSCIDICQYLLVSKSLLELNPLQTVACCTPMTREPMTGEQAASVAAVLKAMADPVRLQLLSLVASHEGGEACVCDLAEAFELSQPTISHHLKILHQAGLLERSKRGVWVYYKVQDEVLDALGKLIASAGA
jgi:ArsR family transcriptional regulator, arsenate/arsenite/antimonite-responsive transcriptional repressor